MKTKDKIIYGLLAVLIGAVGWLSFQNKTAPGDKIAYVRVWDLLTEYDGMKEANKKMSDRQSEQQGNLNDLQGIYQSLVKNYKDSEATFSDEEKLNAQKRISMAQQNLVSYQQTIENAGIEDDPFTQGVLKQMEEFLQVYGKENGYKVIFGSDETGTILYADEAIDITEEVIAALNQEYSGK